LRSRKGEGSDIHGGGEKKKNSFKGCRASIRNGLRSQYARRREEAKKNKKVEGGGGQKKYREKQKGGGNMKELEYKTEKDT